MLELPSLEIPPEVLLAEASQWPKFSYQDLLAMEKLGIISEDEHVELLGGQIFKMTISPPHAMAVSRIAQELSMAFYGKAGVLSQSPLRISDDIKAKFLSGSP
jgi:hypothetical protein